MAAKNTKLNQGLRISEEQLDRMQAISNELARRSLGNKIGVPTVIRNCIERALPLIEAELGLGSFATSKPQPKRRTGKS